jgi:acylglycerol lipase
MENNFEEEMEEYFIGERTFGDYQVKKQILIDDDNGSNIYHSLIRTNNPNKLASVLIVHGLGEHSSRYIELTRYLADANFFVHIFDFRGFGFSSGIRNVSTLKSLNEDIISVFTQIRKDLPLFIVCHSMGAGQIFALLKKNPNLKISGVIFSNPFIDFPPSLNIGFLQQIIIYSLPNDFNVT